MISFSNRLNGIHSPIFFFFPIAESTASIRVWSGSDES